MKDKNTNELLDLIRTLRKARGLTQASMADKMRMEQSQYSRCENGASDLTYSFLVSFSHAQGISVSELLSYPHKIQIQDENSLCKAQTELLLVNLPQLNYTNSMMQNIIEMTQAMHRNVAEIKTNSDKEFSERAYTIQETARRLNLSYNGVLNLVNTGKLGYIEINEKGKRNKKLIPASELRKFLQKHIKYSSPIKKMGSLFSENDNHAA